MKFITHKYIFTYLLLFVLSAMLYPSCVAKNNAQNKTLPVITIDCQESDWNPYAGTFNINISYHGTGPAIDTSTLSVTVNGGDVTRSLTVNTNGASGTVTGIPICTGVYAVAGIKDKSGALSTASCNLPALEVYYPSNNSTINDPLPDVTIGYDSRTTNAGFSVTMDSKDITGLCVSSTTNASCQLPMGQYITPPGSHSVNTQRCFASGGQCCDKDSSFTFIPPVPSINITSPSGYVSPTNTNISVVFSDTTNKLGLNPDTYNVLVDAGNVTSQLVTTTNSALPGFPWTPTSFTANGKVSIGSQGDHTIQASVTDLFYSTTGTASESFTIDATPPSITIAQPISGSASGGSSGTSLPYYIYQYASIPYVVNYNDTQSGINPGSFGININGSDGTISATNTSATGTLPVTLPITSGSNGTGIYTINAQVSDNASNTGYASSTLTLTLANIGIDSASVTTGTQFVVPINVFIDPSRGYGLGSYEIYVNYPSLLLTFFAASGSITNTGADYAPEFQIQPNTFPVSLSQEDISAVTTAGGGSASPAGLFNIANITFHAYASGSGTISITIISLLDTRGQSIPQNRVQSGTVTVSP